MTKINSENLTSTGLLGGKSESGYQSCGVLPLGSLVTHPDSPVGKEPRQAHKPCPLYTV